MNSISEPTASFCFLLCLFGCMGSSLVAARGPLFSCSVRASHCGVLILWLLRSTGSRVRGIRQLWLTGSVAVVLSFSAP